MTAIEKELIAETLKEKFERDQEEKMRKRQMLEGGSWMITATPR